MLILNLADKIHGDIDYKIVEFSDGQTVINLLGKYAEGIVPGDNEVEIISRMTWKDLQLIIGANAALREAGFRRVGLDIPYFLGARSDRKFGKGGYNYLKDVICPIINAQSFDYVKVIDPHSHCVEMGLQRFKKVSNGKLVGWAIRDLVEKHNVDETKLVWLIPDKGATDKAYETIKEVGFKGYVVECAKKRDKDTGKILETTMPHDVIFEGDDCVIVDDICDGGYTFLKLAELAKKRGAGRIFLVVTHGIFSQGFDELGKFLNHIYTTDSIRTIDCGFDTLIESNKDFVSQLNVLVEWRIGKVISMSKGS